MAVLARCDICGETAEVSGRTTALPGLLQSTRVKLPDGWRYLDLPMPDGTKASKAVCPESMQEVWHLFGMEPPHNGCPWCRYSENPDLRDHVRNVHPERYPAWVESLHREEVARLVVAQRSVNCPECGNGFLADRLTDHRHIVHGVAPADEPDEEPLERCPFCVSPQPDLDHHIRLDHPTRHSDWVIGSLSGPDNPNDQECPVCHNVFNSLQGHMKAEHPSVLARDEPDDEEGKGAHD